MKAPFVIVNRLAERLFVEMVASPHEVFNRDWPDLARLAFEAADAFGEESETRFQEARSQADTERAKKALDEANKPR